MYFMLYTAQAPYFMGYKWFRKYTWWHGYKLPMIWKYIEYQHLNMGVKHFFNDHIKLDMFLIENERLEMYLIHNVAQEHFPRKFIAYFDHPRSYWRRRCHFVFYREQPYVREFLIRASVIYPDQLLSMVLNPSARHFGKGMEHYTYTRKWIHYTWQVFNKSRPWGFSKFYGFWVGNFFTEIFTFRALHYRYEFFTDSMKLLWPFIGTAENLRRHVFYVIVYLFVHTIVYWFSIFFVYKKDRFQLLRVFSLTESLPYWSKSYSFVLAYLKVREVQNEKARRLHLKQLHIKLRRKRQLESAYLNFFKNFIFRPLAVWFLNKLIYTDYYRKKVRKYYLGNIDDYDIGKSYMYPALLLLNMPFYIYFSYKTLTYKVHMFYYFTLTKWVRFTSILNAHYTFLFTVLFFNKITVRRELEVFTAFETIERVLNFIHIYSKKEYRDKVLKDLQDTYAHENSAQQTRRNMDDYWAYYYYRTFGSYEPEMEVWSLLKMRYFTRFWYYYTNYTMDFLITHRVPNFFNHFSSPLHVREGNIGLLNFHFFRYFAKPYVIFSYYNYYIYYLILTFDINNFYIDMMLHIFYRSIFSFVKVFKYFGALNWKSFRSISKVWIYVIYNFLKYHFFIIRYIEFFCFFIFVSVYYFFVIIFNIVTWYFIYIVENIADFFSVFFTSDFGLSYKFWQRYYMFRFYLVEYNILLHIFKYIMNFFFNFFLILLCFFILTTLPYFKDILSSDFLIHSIYTTINQLFEYNKLIYFNEVLDNWWVPYFDHGKFVKFYNGYCDYFEIRFKKLFNGWIKESTHLRKKYRYKMFFFNHYFRRHFYWLKNGRLWEVYAFFRWLVPNSYPWEIYLYMSSYFYLVGHPAKHYMPDIFWNTLPIMFTYIYQYKYYIIVSKIFLPLYWFWKYSYSYILFSTLFYFHDTVFFNFFFNFFKYWYNFYFKFNYFLFSFCYNYYFNFLFAYSKAMRYYFITYDFLNHFWVYRSARFFIALDIFNFFKFSLDVVYFSVVGFCYKFFYYIFKCFYFFLNCLGLTSMNSYLNFSMSIIPHFQSFFSEWFDKFVTLNYEVDEYGRILYKHFKQRTRQRQGFAIKKDMANRAIFFIKFRSTTFEVLFRKFLYFNKRGLMKNFLIHNSLRTTSFNVLFFSLTSLYLNYVLLILLFVWFSYKFRRDFKNDLLPSLSPFFEWNRFNSTEVRHSMGRDEFYWLYNIRWLKQFEFYVDKIFVDDLYTSLNRSDIRLGWWLYHNLTKVFVTDEPNLEQTIRHNQFLLYKRYYLERYITIIKNVDFIFHEYAIKTQKTKYMIFHYNNFFLPITDYSKSDFDVNKNMVKEINYLDYYWLFFATPQMFYNRNASFYRAMARDDVSKEIYQKIKKTLFKAYAFFESHDKEQQPFDLFEFQFFDLETYDSFIYENFFGDVNYKISNRYLHRVSRSRFNIDLAYALPNKDITNLFFYLGYSDWVKKLEYYFDYLRSFNEDYCDKMIDLGVYSFIEPLYIVETNVTANRVKDSVDLSSSDYVAGIKYRELYRYEELGTIATENHIYEYIDSVFSINAEGDMTKVALTDDAYMSLRFPTSWVILIILLPMIMFASFFLEFIYIEKFIEPHTAIRETLFSLLSFFFTPLVVEEFLFHGLMSFEHIYQWYWFNPFIWIRTHVFDLYWIDRYSHWEGKHAKFLLAKEVYSWWLILMDCEEMRYDDFTWLQRSFYIFAWEKDPRTVIPFLVWEVIMYVLFVFSSVMIFHGVMYTWDLCRYFVKSPNVVLDEDYTVEKYTAEFVRKEKKDLFQMKVKDMFPHFDIDDHKYAKKKKKKKK